MGLSKYALGLFLLFPLSLHGQGRNWQSDGWDFVSEEDGIKVFSKTFPGSDIKGVGGETIIEAPIGKILWIMVDHPHKPEWINRFKEAHTVEEFKPIGNVQYSAFSLPFPISDRDFVFKNDFTVDAERGSVVIDVKSVESGKEPARNGIVRGEIIKGKYVLTPIDGGRTHMEAEYLADPKGSIPKWVINIFQKQWPRMTMGAMREQVKKPYVHDWEGYTEVLAPQLPKKLKAN